MASPSKRLPGNVPGNFFVDATCINCDACRELAPDSFREEADASIVYAQPRTAVQVHQAYQALVTCPVGSIGTLRSDRTALRQALGSFPAPLEETVFYNGFNSEKSFGAHSYFVRRDAGNWLIDSPRYTRHLVQAFERLGGIRYIMLSHEDDVGDAGRYAEHFGSSRLIHEADVAAMPDAEWVVRGDQVLHVDDAIVLIPVPGHTRGSLAVLVEDRYLFTGDHLWWDPGTRRLEAPAVYVASERHLLESIRRLLPYRFTWVLPGHGHRVQLPPDAMRATLEDLLLRRQKGVPA